MIYFPLNEDVVELRFEFIVIDQNMFISYFFFFVDVKFGKQIVIEALFGLSDAWLLLLLFPLDVLIKVDAHDAIVEFCFGVQRCKLGLKGLQIFHCSNLLLNLLYNFVDIVFFSLGNGLKLTKNFNQFPLWRLWGLLKSSW